MEIKLFRNLKKCAFFSPEVTFLSYIATGDGIKADEGKVEAIRTWLVPWSIHDVRALNGLASF